MENKQDVEEKKVTLQELQNVLSTMNFYNRSNGYIAHDLKGTLSFFDTEPSFGGAYVTKKDIIRYIREY